MKRIYTLLVAAMAAVCGAWADDVTITEVEFSLDVSKIDYFAGNFEGNVSSAIAANLSVASDAGYALDYSGSRLAKVSSNVGSPTAGIGNGEALIGADASKEYLVCVPLMAKSGYAFSETDYTSISVKYNENTVTPYYISYNSYWKTINIYVKLGAWTTGTTTHTLTVKNATYGGAAFTGGSVAEGVKLTLTANTAATGFKFNGWNCTGITLTDATSNVAKFTMPANDVTIEATYVEQVVETLTAVTVTLPTDEIEYQIGVKEKTVSNNISSKITSESSDKYYINKINSRLSYKDDGGTFCSIGDGETTIGSRTNFYEGKEQYYVRVLFQTKSDAIIFTPDASALKVTYNGKEVTPTQVEVKDNKQDLIVFIPLGDPAAAAVTLYTLTCVNAAPESYPYQTFAGGDYEEGASVTFRAKSPNTGELFDHWEATGIELTEEQKTAELLTITMPANAVTITAVYKKIDYKIIIADDIENGTVSVTSGATTANYNDEVALTITPATGYELDEISAKNASGGTVTLSKDYKFTMPPSNVTVTATFKAVTPTALQTAELMGIYAENGRIYGTDGMQIFTLTGQNVTELNGQLNGVYIVKVGEKVQKVVVSRK